MNGAAAMCYNEQKTAWRAQVDTQALVRQFKELQQRMGVYHYAMGIINYDGETAAPRQSAQVRGEVMGALSLISYELFINPQVEALLDALEEQRGSLDRQTARELHLLRKEYMETTCIPKEEFAAYVQLCSDAGSIWREAREKSDYPLFMPYLQQLVDTSKRFAAYCKPGMQPYNVMLDKYEEGVTTAYLDGYFATLRHELVPLIQAIAERPQPDAPFLQGVFPADSQRRLAHRLMALLHVDPQRCTLGETAHPFTSSFTKWDTRITTRYEEGDLLSSLYSVIHEAGHGLYEMGIDDALQRGPLASGSSMGMHESQSRLYENMIGRGRAFQDLLLPRLKDEYPAAFNQADGQALYRAVNRVIPGLIRTEADELTYSMHIMVRYELERALFDGSLAVKDLPDAWNARYREYLGVAVPGDAQGVLQDIHWSGGMFGYFPSYSIGSAYAAQIYAAMNRQIDVEGSIAAGNISAINAWLGDNIHRHGMMYPPAQLLEMACGQPFDVTFHTDYLKNKYTALYGL